MIKDVNDRFDYYSISLQIRQILLLWGNKLVERDWLWFVFQQFYDQNTFWSYINELLSV